MKMMKLSIGLVISLVLTSVSQTSGQTSAAPSPAGGDAAEVTLSPTVTVATPDPTAVTADTLSPTVAVVTSAPTAGESTLAPTVPVVNEPCYVCGNETYDLLNPDGNVTLPSQTGDVLVVVCSALVQDGLDGAIPPEACGYVSAAAQSVCRCIPPDFSCSVCGDGYQVTDLEANITLPTQGTVTCGDLEAAGNNGLLAPVECAAVGVFVEAGCGCTPIGYNCSICGTGLVVTLPDVNLTFQGVEDPISCGDLELAGLAGELSPSQCSSLESIISDKCGCSAEGAATNNTCAICGEDRVSLTPDAELTIPTLDEPVTCAELIAAGLSGVLSSTECIAAQVIAAAGCSCAPVNFTCSICGDGFAVTEADGNITIPGRDPILCSDAEDAGLLGELTATQCAVLLPFALISCGCQEVASSAAPVTAVVPTVAPGGAAPTGGSGSVPSAPTPPENSVPTASPVESGGTAPSTAPSASPVSRLSLFVSISFSGLVVAASVWM